MSLKTADWSRSTIFKEPVKWEKSKKLEGALGCPSRTELLWWKWDVRAGSEVLTHKYLLSSSSGCPGLRLIGQAVVNSSHAECVFLAG